MGLFGSDQEKDERISAEHKWDYFNLSDFRSNSCWTPFTYVVLYISLLISIGCYVIDIFTCSQLLLFDRWSGQIQPVVPLYISRWVFTGCILLSLVLLVYRWIRALRAIRSGGVAKSYLDPLAVRLQSIRMGQNGQGWRRFLVFAELTKSKKGAEYVALFSYFSFEASLRIVLAEGPRQAINAMTLASVMQSQIVPSGQHAAAAGASPVAQFFINIKIYAQGDQIRAVVLFGMLFTLVIWIIAALGLAIACILYIMFLWHHIPSTDGGLKGFCKRKIDGRLQKIVDVKVKKALEKEDKKRLKEEAKSLKGGESVASFKRQPTLPILEDVGDDKFRQMPVLARQNTQMTQATFSSQASTVTHEPLPSLDRQPTVPKLGTDPSRPLPSRTATQSSAKSYGSNAPLVNSAAPMGYGQGGNLYSPTEPPVVSPVSDYRPSISRSQTGQSHSSQRTHDQAQRRMPPPSRQNTSGTQMNLNSRPSPAPYGQFAPGPPRRQNTSDTVQSDGGYFGIGHSNPALSSASSFTGPPRTPGSQASRQQGMQGFDLPPRQGLNSSRPQGNGRPYVAYNATRAVQDQSTNAPFQIQSFNSQSHRSQNSMGRPAPIPRSGTAPPVSDPYDDSIYDSYRNDDAAFSRPAMPTRAATAGPGLRF